MRLYENAKRDQWNATSRLDWSLRFHRRFAEPGLVRRLHVGLFGVIPLLR